MKFGEYSVQEMVNFMNEMSKNERSKYHMTLGKLTTALLNIKENNVADADARLVAEFSDGEQVRLGQFISYRGYYSDLAFEPVLEIEKGKPESTIESILTQCRIANRATFEGYKGGDFIMDEDTPLWIAEYGIDSGVAVMPEIFFDAGTNAYVLSTRDVSD